MTREASNERQLGREKEMAVDRLVVLSNSLLHCRHRRPPLFSSALRSSSLSMEAPPVGYRRNVGICLINSSKKVILQTSLNLSLDSSIFVIFVQVFIRDVVLKSTCADFCCLKVGYTRCLANASGNMMICWLLRYNFCRLFCFLGFSEVRSSSCMFLSSELTSLVLILHLFNYKFYERLLQSDVFVKSRIIAEKHN